MCLQLDYLCTLHNGPDIDSRLGRLPRKLSDSYAELWAQETLSYEAEDMTRLGLALSLLLVPNTPTPAVFARFVFGDDDNDDDCTETESAIDQIQGKKEVGGYLIRKAKQDDPLLEMVTTLCFGLVIFDKTTNSFRFAHVSVQEYITARKDGYESPSQSHARIAKRCMSVLVEPESVVNNIHAFTNRLLLSEKGDDKRLSTMFLTGYDFNHSPDTDTIDWVSSYWAYHLDNSNEIRKTPSLMDLETRLQNSASENPWESLNPFVFFSACEFNNLQLVQRWLCCHPKLALLRADMGEEDARAITALHSAACSGNLEVAGCLINAGADVEAQSSTRKSCTPLHFAITIESLQVIRLLLQIRDQKHIDHCYSSKEDTSLLKIAIGTGNEAIVHALLDHGFSPSAGERLDQLRLQLQLIASFPESSNC